jgi:serine/threonine protein kinase
LQIPRNPPPGLQHAEEWHPELSDFVAECLVKDLEQRPFARELLEHPLTKRGAVTTSQVCPFGSDIFILMHSSSMLLLSPFRSAKRSQMHKLLLTIKYSKNKEEKINQ